MKFGKIMQNQLDDTIPEWREKFLCYKQLKKRLKSLQAPVCFTKAAFARSCSTKDPSDELDVVYTDKEARGEKRGAGDLVDSDASDNTPFDQPSPKKRKKLSMDDSVEELSAVTADDSCGILLSDENSNEENKVAEQVAKDTEFIRLLNVELDKFNNFFMEKEEEYVIRLHQLKERIEKVKVKYAENGSACDRSCEEECTRIQMDIVAFHGEMVLLENYSSLNYIGLVKILKKHDKRTGAVLRMPFITAAVSARSSDSVAIPDRRRERREASNSRRLLKLKDEIEKLVRSLQSCLSVVSDISSVLVLLGASPLRPKQIYEVQLDCQVNDFRDETEDHRSDPSKPSADLSRKLIRALISDGATPSAEGTMKLFVAVRASAKSSGMPEDFHPKRGFAISSKKTGKTSVRIVQHQATNLEDEVSSISLSDRSPSQSRDMEICDSADDEDYIWYQCRHTVKGLFEGNHTETG